MTYDANGSPVDDYSEAVAWLHSVSGFRHEPWPSEIRRCARLALQFFNGDLAKVKEFFPAERRINSADVQSAILYFERQIDPPPPEPEVEAKPIREPLLNNPYPVCKHCGWTRATCSCNDSLYNGE